MSPTEVELATSVLVVGTGGAGLRAAIELSERGVDVIAVGKRRTMDSHTTLGTAGVSAALATVDADDTWQQHAVDTLRAGCALGDPRAVQIVTQGAPRGIAELERAGLRF